MKPQNTVEVFSLSHSAKDLWDEMNQEEGSKGQALYFQDGVRTRFRLLGPFIKAERLYRSERELANTNMYGVTRPNRNNRDTINQLRPAVVSFLNHSTIYSILRGNKKVYLDAVETIEQEAICGANPIAKHIVKACKDGKSEYSKVFMSPSDPQKNNKYLQTLFYIADVFYRTKWQKVILCNCMVRDNNQRGNGSKIRIITINKAMCASIMESVSTAKLQKKISGLNAHDITIIKRGRGYSTQFRATLSDSPIPLSEEEIRYVFGIGLVDIPKYLKSKNETESGYFWYRQPSSYKMPEHLLECLKNEHKDLYPDREEDDHFQSVEENLNDIPMDAFENRPDGDNPIDNLEVD